MNPYEYHEIKRDTCWYCGVELTNFNRDSDCFWPNEFGGQVSVSCCKVCKGLKGNKTPRQFIEMLKELRTASEESSNKYKRMIRATSVLWERIKTEL